MIAQISKKTGKWLTVDGKWKELLRILGFIRVKSVKIVGDQGKARKNGFLGRHARRQSALRQLIQREGRHHTRPRLVQFGENLHKLTTEAVHNASRLFAFKFGLESLQRHTPSQNSQRRHSRGCLRQSQGQSTWQRMRQHLCGRSHHLSRQTQTLRVLGTTPTIDF